MALQRKHILAGAALAALIGLGIWKTREKDGSGSSSGGTEAFLPAPPTPEQLLADVCVATPNQAWARLQRGIGGAVGILPATLPGIIVTFADLDVVLADEVDGNSPLFAVLAGEPTDPRIAVAMKLVDARRARKTFLDGENARFTATEASGMTLLVPKPGQSKDRQFELAISSNGYLVAARRSADLGTLGAYAARTLPTRPLPQSAASIEIPHSALSALTPRLEMKWREAKAFLVAEDERMRAQKNRAPDFGDPAPLIGFLDTLVGQRLSIVGDLEKIKISIEVGEDAISATATAAAHTNDGAARKWIDGMKLGDASPVLALPGNAALAVSVRDEEAERTAQMAELEKALSGAVGSRMKDPAKIHDVMDAATKARGDWVSAAYFVDAPTALLVKAPVRDSQAVDHALHGMFDLAQVDPFKTLLRVHETATSTLDVPGLGSASVLTLAREEAPVQRKEKDGGAPVMVPAPTGPNAPVYGKGMAWAVDKGQLTLALGVQPGMTLKETTGVRTLHDATALGRFAGAVGDDASLLVIAQPLRMDPIPMRAGQPAAPVTLAIGRKSKEAFVRVEAADGLLREIARAQMGL